MMTLCEIAAIAAFTVLAGGAQAETDVAATGKALVASNCSRCHAIGMHDSSPHKEALPFREVVHRYPPEQLAEALAEGIMSGHPDMPEFTFEPADIAAIIAYLATLKAPQDR